MNCHTEILSLEQKKMTSFIELFKKRFVLVGWTAIALQEWHRKSIDFDLFVPQREYLKGILIHGKIIKRWFDSILEWYKNDHQRHYILNGVKAKRFAYLYDIPQEEILDLWFARVPSLLFLAAMKCHALSGRGKWKDYVDLYFLIRKFGLATILSKARKHFHCNDKLICNQLCYHDDIDYSEEVERMSWHEVSKDEINEYLITESLKMLDA